MDDFASSIALEGSVNPSPKKRFAKGSKLKKQNVPNQSEEKENKAPGGKDSRNIVFVEAYDESGSNLSADLKEKIRQLGGAVSDTIKQSITHAILHNCREATFDKISSLKTSPSILPVKFIDCWELLETPPPTDSGKFSVVPKKEDFVAKGSSPNKRKAQSPFRKVSTPVEIHDKDDPMFNSSQAPPSTAEERPAKKTRKTPTKGKAAPSAEPTKVTAVSPQPTRAKLGRKKIGASPPAGLSPNSKGENDGVDKTETSKLKRSKLKPLHASGGIQIPKGPKSGKTGKASGDKKVKTTSEKKPKKARAPQARSIFMKEESKRIKDANEKLNEGLLKVLNARWAALDDDGRKPYIEQAEAETARMVAAGEIQPPKVKSAKAISDEEESDANHELEDDDDADTDSDDDDDNTKTTKHIACSGCDETVRETLLSVVKSWGHFTYNEDNVGPLTHLVLSGSTRKVKVLNAIAQGAWILTEEWIFKSIEEGSFVSEAPYVNKTFPASEKSRASHDAKEDGLFAKMQFHVVGNYGKVDVEELKELIRACGGAIVGSLAACDVAICGDSPRRPPSDCSKYVSAKWLFDSIVDYTKLNTSNYLVFKDSPGQPKQAPKKKTPRGKECSGADSRVGKKRPSPQKVQETGAKKPKSEEKKARISKKRDKDTLSPAKENANPGDDVDHEAEDPKDPVEPAKPESIVKKDENATMLETDDRIGTTAALDSGVFNETGATGILGDSGCEHILHDTGASAVTSTAEAPIFIDGDATEERIHDDHDDDKCDAVEETADAANAAESDDDGSVIL